MKETRRQSGQPHPASGTLRHIIFGRTDNLCVLCERLVHNKSLFSESKQRKFVITSALLFLGHRAVQKLGAVVVKLIDFLIPGEEPVLDFLIGARFGKCLFRFIGLTAQVKEFLHCSSVFIIVSLNILFHIRIGQSLEAGLLFGRRSSDNLPYLKGVPLKKVTPLQIQLILGNLSGQSKSLNDKAIQILRGIFNAAVDNNLIAKSPVPLRLRSGGIATKEKAALTVEQSRQLLNAVFETWAYLFCLIALQTGLRCGEICGLMWSDIDFDAQIIHVRHNAIFTSAQTVVSSDLKTAAARRDIPIPPTLLALLTSEKNGSESPFVLHMDNGGALSQTSFSNLWDMVRSLDFHVTPHQLRHTYITRLFESGLDIKEIQYLAGHTTIDMTLRIYTHYQHESRRKETAKKFCEALG